MAVELQLPLCGDFWLPPSPLIVSAGCPASLVLIFIKVSTEVSTCPQEVPFACLRPLYNSNYSIVTQYSYYREVHKILMIYAPFLAYRKLKKKKKCLT